MSHSRLGVVATIIAVVVIVGFVLSVPHTRDLPKAPTSGAAPVVPAISIKDSFKKGLHTITGSLTVLNACTFVTARATLISDASSTGSILVALSFQNDSGVCLQTPTQANFSTTVTAPAHLPITATVNGSTATTTVL